MDHMNQRFCLGFGTSLSAAGLLLLGACASSGSSFGSGGSENSSGTSTTTGTNGTTGGGDSTTGGGGDSSGTGVMTTTGSGGADTTGGTGGTSNPGTGGSANPGTGGSMTMGGDAGSVTTSPCPAGHGQNGICHEYYANDNYNHVINYVNDFTGDPAKASLIWQAHVYNKAGVGGNEPNSPRTIEVVDNKSAKSGKAVMVSLETGYGEYDTTDGSKLIEITSYTGISGACRLPDGTTALGQDSKIIIITNTGAHVRDIPIPQGDNLRAINRNPADGHFWFSKTSLIYEVNDQGGQVWSGNMGAGTKGYAVWWRAGGGAYATTGDPSSVIELDGTGKILSTVGGKGQMFPFLDFFSGFVRFSNGNYLVANWLGHLGTPSVDAPEVVEFAAPPKNEIVYKWPVMPVSAAYPKGNQSIARQITNVYAYR
jgi:hypothetical protein